MSTPRIAARSVGAGLRLSGSCLLLVTGCAAHVQYASPRSGAPAPDSVAFARAVDRLWQGADSTRFFVTAVPQLGAEDALDPEKLVDTTAVGVAAIVAARRRALISRGIREGPIPRLADCPQAPVIEGSLANCPAEDIEALVVGLPRPGGAYVPNGGYDERESGKALGEWSVRAIRVSAGKFGSNLSGLDVVVKEVGGEWLFQRVVYLWSGF